MIGMGIIQYLGLGLGDYGEIVNKIEIGGCDNINGVRCTRIGWCNNIKLMIEITGRDAKCG